MPLTCPSLSCLELRPFSALLVGVYAVVAWAGMGLSGVVVHTLWFALLLSRRGRAMVLVASVIVGVVGLTGCATRSGVATVLMATAIVTFLAAGAWLAAHGIDYLESTWHGQAMESQVRRVLDGLAASAPTATAVQHGVLLRNGRSFTEIDHVLLTGCGIVVIETKGYVGRIVFNPESGRWSRTKGRGEPEEIEDPLAQNDRHVQAIRRLFPEAPIFSLVVMPRAILESCVPAGVVTLSDLRRSFEDWIAPTKAAFEVGVLQQRLAQQDRSSPENRRAHLNWLHHVRQQGIHPLLQRRLATFAGTLYFGLPGLLMIWLH